jgi:glycosyltransferase involved in cell wall biosynthesis
VGQVDINFRYQLIIANDASTDSTATVIDGWINKSKVKKADVIYVDNPDNLGLVSNVFNALKYCTGEYVALCGGDDVWLPNKLAKQMQSLAENPEYGVVYSKAYKCNEMGEVTNPDETEGFAFGSFELLLKRNSIPASTAIIKAHLIDMYVKEINPLNKPWVMEDYPLWLWCSQNTKIKFLEFVTVKYRVLTESASHSKSYVKNKIFSVSRLEVILFFCKKYNKLLEPSLLESYYFNFVELSALQMDKKALRAISAEILPFALERKTFKSLFSLVGCYFPATYVYITTRIRLRKNNGYL